MAKRKIIKIDEDKCNGCGLCIPNCHEGAIKLIDGKARLVNDIFCDGLGACLGHCPQGAITIEERDAAPFDEKAVRKNKREEVCSCPGSKMVDMRGDKEGAIGEDKGRDGVREGRGREGMREDKGREWKPELTNWPVQIRLVPTNAPYLKGADVLVAADCVPFAYPAFHEKLLSGKVLLVGCPKLDDIELYKEKINEMVKNNGLKSITYARMEVPCCSGLAGLIREAIEISGKNIPFEEIVISIKGERIK